MVLPTHHVAVYLYRRRGGTRKLESASLDYQPLRRASSSIATCVLSSLVVDPRRTWPEQRGHGRRKSNRIPHVALHLPIHEPSKE